MRINGIKTKLRSYANGNHTTNVFYFQQKCISQSNFKIGLFSLQRLYWIVLKRMWLLDLETNRTEYRDQANPVPCKQDHGPRGKSYSLNQTKEGS